MAKGKSQETEVQRVVLRPLASIKPNPKNPRTSDPEGLENLCESIKANPAFFNARPILLSDRTGELVIIGGERRSEAAKRLGMTEVPTILLSGLNEAQEDEIMVRDNTHNGRWDDRALARLAKGWGEEVVKAWAPGVSWMPIVTDDEVKHLFEKSTVGKKEKPVYVVAEVPHYIDAEIVRAKVRDAVADWPDVKVK